MASLMGLVCIAALAACGSGTVSKPPTGTTAITGPVTVTTNLSAYSVNDAIGIDISNTSTTDFYAVSGK